MNKSKSKASATKSHVMLAYHGDAQFRKRFLAEIRKHEKADALIRGSYGTGSGATWKGCAVGCSLHSLNLLRNDTNPTKDTATHARYPGELGIPIELAYLEEHLFERLPEELAVAWPMRFSSAIRSGADLSLVWDRFALWLLVDETDGVIRFAKKEPTRVAIRGVAALFERRITGGTVTRAEWNEARSATDATATDATDAAADAAYADAAYAADAAADAAYAADDAARSRSFARQADKLVELLKSAPVRRAS